MVEPFQLGVDFSWMAHDDTAIGQAIEKRRKQPGVCGVRAKRIGAGKGRIGPQPVIGREPAEAAAQAVQHQRLVIGEAPARRQLAALPHPGAGRELLGHAQHGVADLRKQMHVVVAVDKIRRPAEGGSERFELSRNLDGQKFWPQRAQMGAAQRRRPATGRRRGAAAQNPARAARTAPSGSHASRLEARFAAA